MKVVAVQECFIGGSLRRPGGPAFEFTPKKTPKNPEGKLPKCLQEVADVVVAKPVASSEPAKYAEKDNGDLRVMLAEAGLKVPPQWRREKLIEALVELDSHK